MFIQPENSSGRIRLGHRLNKKARIWTGETADIQNVDDNRGVKTLRID